MSGLSTPPNRLPKACDGIAVVPMKGALMKTLPATVAANPAASRYTPPSKRKEELKAPTKEELDSDILFPTLSPMKPLTPGANWSQLRKRLSQNPFSALDTDSNTTQEPITPSMDFMRVMQERIKADKHEEEEGIRLENIKEPALMSIEKREENGWTTISLPLNHQQFNHTIASQRVLTEEDMYDSRSPWTLNPRFECVHLGGAPVQRKEDIDYFARFSINSEQAYTPVMESSVLAATNRMLAFVGKSKV